MLTFTFAAEMTLTNVTESYLRKLIVIICTGKMIGTAVIINK